MSEKSILSKGKKLNDNEKDRICHANHVHPLASVYDFSTKINYVLNRIEMSESPVFKINLNFISNEPSLDIKKKITEIISNDCNSKSYRLKCATNVYYHEKFDGTNIKNFSLDVTIITVNTYIESKEILYDNKLRKHSDNSYNPYKIEKYKSKKSLLKGGAPICTGLKIIGLSGIYYWPISNQISRSIGEHLIECIYTRPATKQDEIKNLYHEFQIPLAKRSFIIRVIKYEGYTKEAQINNILEKSDAELLTLAVGPPTPGYVISNNFFKIIDKKIFSKEIELRDVSVLFNRMEAPTAITQNQIKRFDDPDPNPLARTIPQVDYNPITSAQLRAHVQTITLSVEAIPGNIPSKRNEINYFSTNPLNYKKQIEKYHIRNRFLAHNGFNYTNDDDAVDTWARKFLIETGLDTNSYYSYNYLHSYLHILDHIPLLEPTVAPASIWNINLRQLTEYRNQFTYPPVIDIVSYQKCAERILNRNRGAPFINQIPYVPPPALPAVGHGPVPIGDISPASRERVLSGPYQLTPVALIEKRIQYDTYAAADFNVHFRYIKTFAAPSAAAVAAAVSYRVNLLPLDPGNPIPVAPSGLPNDYYPGLYL
jgi:hypothetical protein